MFAKSKKSSDALEEGAIPAAEKTASAAASGLPLFFSKPSVLDVKRHAKAGIRMNMLPDFARMTNSIPLMIGEFMEAAKFYPILFAGNDVPMPIALVGMEKDNYFVQKDGAWLQNIYIPAYVRKYPFVFLEIPESDQLALCVDEGAPQFTMDAKGEDAKLFDGDKPSEFTSNALTFCSAIHQENHATKQFCEWLKAHDLFAPNRSEATLNSGRTITLGGFQLIDREKFTKLSDADIMELHKKGWLPLVYYAIQSTSNWGRLVDLAAAGETASKTDKKASF